MRVRFTEQYKESKFRINNVVTPTRERGTIESLGSLWEADDDATFIHDAPCHGTCACDGSGVAFECPIGGSFRPDGERHQTRVDGKKASTARGPSLLDATPDEARRAAGPDCLAG
jgi:hypothetical protein